MKSPRHTARGIVIHDDKLLLIERFRGRLHYFSIPGGGIEAGETPEETVLREILEETSCEVRLVRPLYVLKRGDVLHHIYLCEYVSGTPHLPANSPEARHMKQNNRFEPTWLPLRDIRTSSFMIWKPIQKQLLQDLQSGFRNEPLEILAQPLD